MNKKLASFLLSLASSCVSNAATLTPNDLTWEAAFVGTLIADYSQTRQIAHFCDGRIGCTMHETNPLLGDCPSENRVRNYFIGAALTHLLITAALPPSVRGIWLKGSVGFEIAVIGHNKSIGLDVKF